MSNRGCFETWESVGEKLLSQSWSYPKSFGEDPLSCILVCGIDNEAILGSWRLGRTRYPLLSHQSSLVPSHFEVVACKLQCAYPPKLFRLLWSTVFLHSLIFGPYILGVFSIWSLNFKSFQLSSCVFTPFSIIHLASSLLKICICDIWKLLNVPMRVRHEYYTNPLSPNPNPLTSCRVRRSCQILPLLVAIISGLVHSLDESFTKIKNVYSIKNSFWNFVSIRHFSLMPVMQTLFLLHPSQIVDPMFHFGMSQN